MAARRKLAGIPALAAMVLLSAAAPAGPGPEIPAAVLGEACVEPVEVMRREHMTFLFAQRDRTVHGGERETRHSLDGCLTCHTRTDGAGSFVPIDAPGEFCYECHAFSSVKMDCFDCHASRPAAAPGS